VSLVDGSFAMKYTLPFVRDASTTAE